MCQPTAAEVTHYRLITRLLSVYITSSMKTVRDGAIAAIDHRSGPVVLMFTFRGMRSNCTDLGSTMLDLMLRIPFLSG